MDEEEEWEKTKPKRRPIKLQRAVNGEDVKEWPDSIQALWDRRLESQDPRISWVNLYTPRQPKNEWGFVYVVNRYATNLEDWVCQIRLAPLYEDNPDDLEIIKDIQKIQKGEERDE